MKYEAQLIELSARIHYNADTAYIHHRNMLHIMSIKKHNYLVSLCWLAASDIDIEEEFYNALLLAQK